MRISAHHKALGDEVVFKWTGTPERSSIDNPDRVYASAIFEKTLPSCELLKALYPEALIGGTGVNVSLSLEDYGIGTKNQDYSLYPQWMQSIGFTQRGCRLKCSFCVVPRKEGGIREEQSIWDIWRGEPFPRELILLDTDFFGQPNWRQRIAEIREGGFKVSFNQGINARFLSDETAEAIASVNYRDDSMKVKRIYTAWDNRRDEDLLFAGLSRLVKYGVKPDHIMVYILIGYDHIKRCANPSLSDDDFHRHRRLREFGCRPYPMPFIRNRETMGFQRWIIGAYDKRVAWDDFKAAEYRPEKLGNKNLRASAQSAD